MKQQWYKDYGNIVVLTAWLADSGSSAKTVAHAVEKPWHYETEWRSAIREAVSS